MRLLVDTDILVHDTIEDSDKHLEAAELLDEAERIYIPSIVLHEYLWVTLRKLNLSSELVSEKIEEYLTDSRTFYVCENIGTYRKALQMLKEDGKPPQRINDYIIIALAQALGASIATYDPELREAATSRDIKVVP